MKHMVKKSKSMAKLEVRQERKSESPPFHTKSITSHGGGKQVAEQLSSANRITTQKPPAKWSQNWPPIDKKIKLNRPNPKNLRAKFQKNQPPSYQSGSSRSKTLNKTVNSRRNPKKSSEYWSARSTPRYDGNTSSGNWVSTKMSSSILGTRQKVRVS